MKLQDLQENWNKFGEQDPLWGILAWPDKSQNRWEIDAFFATGVAEIEEVLAYLERLDVQVAREAALDFGCGVGRLTQALAPHFRVVHGVDISPAMLALAEQYNRFGDRCRYHLNEADDLGLFADGSFDFIYSNITLQHMPPRFARAYLLEFLRVLRPGGVLVFQIPSAPRQKWRLLLQPLKPTRLWRLYRRLRYNDRPVMEMYCIPKARVLRLLRAHGARVVDVQPDTSADAAWISYRYCVTR
ncbi:MAG: class I SAM-dependent methyltransferase [Caldilineae bacterium]|nr:MAG: class I SAM-dependent methyltransferase [Caldilineae bacterium]